jgi:hypothetical protein
MKSMKEYRSQYSINRKYKHNKHKNINKSTGEHTFPQITGARSAASEGSALKIIL